MKDYNFFDVVGPIMIGPSSSHTAGAARIAKAASEIAGTGFIKVVFNLHGSFAETYLGHGTDKALVAGVLGYEPDDERIKHSYEIAAENGIEVEFEKIIIPNGHPNTVKLDFHYPDGSVQEIVGISVGGGAYEITEVNGLEVSLDGRHPTIILNYFEQKGVISKISSLLADNDYNISTIKNILSEDNVSLIIELDDPLGEHLLEKINDMDIFKNVTYINLSN